MSEEKGKKRTTVEKATDQFLRVLRERNASAHTIKAYAGDLENFANYVGSRDWCRLRNSPKNSRACRPLKR